VGAIAAGTVGEGVEEEGAGNAAKKAKKSKGAMGQLSL